MIPAIMGVLLPATAFAAEPWHTTRNHTDLWSPIDDHATGAVVARELVLAPTALRAVIDRGREAAMWDLQPGQVDVEARKPEGDRPVFANTHTLRALGHEDGASGFVVQYRADGKWLDGHEGDRAPVYALAGGDHLVVWDGEVVHITRIWDRSDEFVDHAKIRVDRFLTGDRYWIGFAEESLISPTPMLQIGIFDEPSGGQVPKVYVLPVDPNGQLVVGPPGLVISLDADDDEHKNVLRAAWVRTDLAPAPWPDGVRAKDNPHRDRSAVSQVPPIDPYDEQLLYVDGILEGGVAYHEFTGNFRAAVGGELGVGGRFWTAQALVRPQLVGAAGWVHSNRRRPWGAGFGALLGAWAGKARPGVGARLAFPVDIISKVELEGLLTVDRVGAGVRYTFFDWNLERKRYLCGGFVGRISTGDLFTGSQAWVGLTFSYSHRHTWVSVF